MTAPTTGTEGSAATPPVETEGGEKPDSGWAPPASQADLDRIVESRLARERAKFADYDEIKAKAEKHDALELELSSEAEKQAREAAKKATEEAESKYRPKLAETAFRIAIGDRKTADEVTDFIADLNLSRFLTETGDVDTAKVLARVEQFTGNNKTTTPSRIGPSASGQGTRAPAGDAKGDAARAWLTKQGIKVDS